MLLCRNGRWRSQWTVSFDPSAIGEMVEVKGVVKVQVHYYEDGNVQLVSSKDIKQTIQVAVSSNKLFTRRPLQKLFQNIALLNVPVSQNESEFALEFVKLAESSESEYHNALSKTN